MILEALVQQKHPGSASLASVCQEWHLVHYIRLEIELPRYTWRCCGRDVSVTVAKHNSSIVSEGIWKLFHVLSSWNSEGQTCIASGFALELNVYCLSYSKHWFKTSIPNARSEDDDSNWHDPPHGWVNGRQVFLPPASAIPRLFGKIWIDIQKELPEADSVTRPIVRRQLRHTPYPSDFQAVLEQLSALEQPIFEPWRRWENTWRVIQGGRRRFATMPLRTRPQISGYL
ncbi:uncharacterized protein THITE_2038503 [Thermothielavioides terrestris NRRL 8126]|uniref:Uncharacterized protein n=1 Tax=Thermothielavioides terrestris (strain ATCC 38088 / NRRL 8126) TaxID=578455 RepID=G2QQZ2_THETT|nr:uncharacterized protein THITE_2038503 [Thermothielavioides terrestris NRRL 8126]AEO62444.1 hypothetical protein THITE_2038503 [Thermothielavioides terrestris NRRL 8126]